MGLSEVLLGVVFTVAISLAVTVTTSAETHWEFWSARACYLIASSSLALTYFIWLIKAIDKPLINTEPKLILFFITTSLVGAISIFGNRYVDSRIASNNDILVKKIEESSLDFKISLECDFGFDSFFELRRDKTLRDLMLLSAPDESWATGEKATVLAVKRRFAFS